MKTCKKILAITLALVIVMSCAAFTVNAADTANNKDLWTLWDFSLASTTSGTCSGSKTLTILATKDLTTSAVAKTYVIPYASNEGATFAIDGKVLNVETTRTQSTYREWFYGGTTDTDRMNGNDILNHSGWIKIAAEQYNANTPDTKYTVAEIQDMIIQASFPFTTGTYDGTTAINSASNKSNYNPAFNITNDGAGNVTIVPYIATKYATLGEKGSKTVSVDSWIEYDIEVHVKPNEAVKFYYYINGEKIGEATSNAVLDPSLGYGIDSPSIITTSTGGVLGTKGAQVFSVYSIKDLEIYTSSAEEVLAEKPLTIEGDKANGVTLTANLLAPGFDSADLVVAFYDSNNKLVAGSLKKFDVAKDENGYILINETANAPATATKVKLFLFDDIGTAIPLMANASLGF